MTKLLIDQIKPYGETGWLVQLRGESRVHVALGCQAVCRVLEQSPVFHAVAPGLSSIAVQFDPLTTQPDHALHLVECAIKDHGCFQIVATPGGECLEIPVRTDGDHAPDLGHVAAETTLSPEAVLAHLFEKPLTVLNMGFAPGFAYLGEIPDVLSLPRRKTPRMHVPAGSLALAAGYAGIYSLACPGGWHIVGRTSLVLFDPSRAMPFTLAPGRQIRFVAEATPSRYGSDSSAGKPRRSPDV